jgi:endonuclease G
VHRRLDEPALEAATRAHLTERFPAEIDGIPIDVVELPPVHQNFMFFRSTAGTTLGVRRGVVRDPVIGGIGIGPSSANFAGTLGAVVVDRQSGTPMILSNYHVLYDRYSRPVEDIIQPSRLEGGGVGDVIGHTERHAMNRTLDAAVAALTGTRRFSVMQLGIGPVRGFRSPSVGDDVQKSGFGSRVTRGLVTSTTMIQDIRGRDGVLRRYRDVVFIEPRESYQEVSSPGDSGAIWLDTNMNAVALHFAGRNRPEKACALDLFTVIDALGVDLMVQPA